MNAIRRICSDVRYFAACNLFNLALGISLLPGVIHGQAARNEVEGLATAIARVESGEVDARDVEIITKAGQVQAAPALEGQFARTTDLKLKMKIASGLVRLGDKSDAYWNFLLQQATVAVDSDLPDPFHDSHGNPTGQRPSPEFLTWTQVHHVDLSTAVMDWTYDLPIKIMLLGETGDSRGTPLLRRALQSHNYQIVAWASKGLALIQDKESIPLIIVAIQTAPPEYNSLIAESLVYFDEVPAQNAVDNYMPRDKAATERDAKARGRGPFG